MAADTLAPREAMIGIYVHVPFCRSICPYCDFLRQILHGDVPEPFLQALGNEIDRFEPSCEADTVFLGGGTSSLLAPAALGRVLDALDRRFKLVSPEITIEANPDDVTPDLADAWIACGINRVSLGVQSFDDDTLRYLGRRHDLAGARKACAIIADRFDNWAMDLIFGVVPLEAWPATLKTCMTFEPKHVSTYGLTYEPETPFGERAYEAVDDETYLALYRAAKEHLHTFDRYEIANFAQPGFECRHNLKYWRNLDYVGFGPGAYSYVNGVRSRNPAALETYIANPGTKDQQAHLTERQIMTETLIQHFRLKRGIHKQAYFERFGRRLRDDYGTQLNALVARGLLVEDDDAFRPTDNGFELNDEIGLALVDTPG